MSEISEVIQYLWQITEGWHLLPPSGKKESLHRYLQVWNFSRLAPAAAFGQTERKNKNMGYSQGLYEREVIIRFSDADSEANLYTASPVWIRKFDKLVAEHPENFREVKNKINGFLYKEDFPDSYNAKSLILVDCSDDEIFVSKNENEPQIPASLAKLFVIEYASTLADLDSIVVADYGAISLTKPGSSVAQIKEKEYFLHNLFAAMLVPSGNDAAYVVADYCGGLLSPQAESCQERVRIFMENLNLHLQQQGYLDTVLYDPSGFDMEALTTTLDLKEVVYRLLEYSWFREIVSQNTYTATLPDGSTQIWQNTNAFLDPTSEYYNENVCGIKTGSLSDDYNLIVLYQQHGKEFLICSLGSQSDSSRYDDVNFILKTINESYYLTQ